MPHRTNPSTLPNDLRAAFTDDELAIWWDGYQAGAAAAAGDPTADAAAVVALLLRTWDWPATRRLPTARMGDWLGADHMTADERRAAYAGLLGSWDVTP